jgi:hypothetical protein
LLTERQFQILSGQAHEDKTAKSDFTYLKFAALEEEVAHCYFVLQERFIATPRLAKLWAEAALDELQHASILRYCRERQLFADDPVEAGTAARIDDLLETIATIIADPGATAADAFYAALLIESSELDDVFEDLTRPLAKDHPLLYQGIRANLHTHHNRFADGAAEFAKDKAYAAAFSAFAREQKRAFREKDSA